MNELVLRGHQPPAIPWFLQWLIAKLSERPTNPHPGHGVFIVEDHAGMRRALARLVGRAPNFRVVGEAASAEEALERFAAERPALALVDINLPGMSGIELIGRIAREHPHIRCVVVSAYADSERVRAAMSAGARAFVSKDDPDRIAATLAEVADSE